MKCSNCGASLAPNAIFCDKCGSNSILQDDSLQNTSFQDTNGWGQTPPHDDPFGTLPQGHHPHWQQPYGMPPYGPQWSQQEQQSTSPSLIVAIIGAVLVGISWFVPLVVDLFFSVPAIILGLVAGILGFLEIKKTKQRNAEKSNTPLIRVRSEGMIMGFCVMAGAFISTIIFISLIFIVYF